jgi:hypothetical protein
MYKRDQNPEEKMPDAISIMVTNRDLFGVSIREIPGIIEHSFVFPESYIMEN